MGVTLFLWLSREHGIELYSILPEHDCNYLLWEHFLGVFASVVANLSKWSLLSVKSRVELIPHGDLQFWMYN